MKKVGDTKDRIPISSEEKFAPSLAEGLVHNPKCEPPFASAYFSLSFFLDD